MKMDTLRKPLRSGLIDYHKNGYYFLHEFEPLEPLFVNTSLEKVQRFAISYYRKAFGKTPIKVDFKYIQNKLHFVVKKRGRK